MQSSLRIEMYQGKVQLIFLGVLKHQKVIVAYLVVLKHQESCGLCLWRLNHIRHVTTDEFTVRKRLKQNVAHVYSEKLKEPKLN